MAEMLTVRESTRDDIAAIESLYPEAFPDEDLLPVVRDLLADTIVAMSLVGTIDTQVAGHAIFTKCGVTGSSISASLLAPLAVAPRWQRQGIGSELVRAGLRRLGGTGVQRVFVLGDPTYYRRLGFHPENRVEPPYPLPAEWDGAWQSQRLSESAASCEGTLSVPPQWRQPALWAP
ncbi:MAG: GNAT family N-acetyltransferase [Gammaproteobacteria bacterium]